MSTLSISPHGLEKAQGRIIQELETYFGGVAELQSQLAQVTAERNHFQNQRNEKSIQLHEKSKQWDGMAKDLLEANAKIHDLAKHIHQQGTQIHDLRGELEESQHHLAQSKDVKDSTEYMVLEVNFCRLEEKYRPCLETYLDQEKDLAKEKEKSRGLLQDDDAEAPKQTRATITSRAAEQPGDLKSTLNSLNSNTLDRLRTSQDPALGCTLAPHVFRAKGLAGNSMMKKAGLDPLQGATVGGVSESQ